MLRSEGDAMDIEALDTPAVVIDLDRVDANLAAAQRYADEHGLALRPHVKTHKLPALAHRQVALGAVGITAQKIGEAAVMVAAGIEDVLLSYPLVGDTKLEPLARLARATPRLAVALDNAVSLDLVGRAAAEAERTIDVLIEFESGRARTGVIEPDEALALARAIEAHPRLRLRGFMTYPLGPGAGDWVHARAPCSLATGSRRRSSRAVAPRACCMPTRPPASPRCGLVRTSITTAPRSPPAPAGSTTARCTSTSPWSARPSAAAP
jgi:D-serine deaminase-like pyridoxal phosphate-dependent protein